MRRSFLALGLVGLLSHLAVGAGFLGWAMSPSPYTPPTGWKTVSFRGISVSVPGIWPVSYHGIVNRCRPTGPKIDVDPSGYFTGSCVQLHPKPVPALVVVGPEGHTPIRHPRSTTVNGVSVEYEITFARHGLVVHTASASSRDIVTSIAARVPTYRVGITIQVGNSARFPGGAPGRALQFLDSIRPASPSATPHPAASTGG